MQVSPQAFRVLGELLHSQAATHSETSRKASATSNLIQFAILSASGNDEKNGLEALRMKATRQQTAFDTAIDDMHVAMKKLDGKDNLDIRTFKALSALASNLEGQEVQISDLHTRVRRLISSNIAAPHAAPHQSKISNESESESESENDSENDKFESGNEYEDTRQQQHSHDKTTDEESKENEYKPSPHPVSARSSSLSSTKTPTKRLVPFAVSTMKTPTPTSTSTKRQLPVSKPATRTRTLHKPRPPSPMRFDATQSTKTKHVSQVKPRVVESNNEDRASSTFGLSPVQRPSPGANVEDYSRSLFGAEEEDESSSTTNNQLHIPAKIPLPPPLFPGNEAAYTLTPTPLSRSSKRPPPLPSSHFERYPNQVKASKPLSSTTENVLSQSLSSNSSTFQSSQSIPFFGDGGSVFRMNDSDDSRQLRRNIPEAPVFLSSPPQFETATNQKQTNSSSVPPPPIRRLAASNFSSQMSKLKSAGSRQLAPKKQTRNSIISAALASVRAAHAPVSNSNSNQEF